ncbi:uncharacterized protein LOC124939577 [Impatiens glandulifera]|uniref:uncharacterized protein LOC124939577 n=1 Tax=Impatiens glandulifera TaxID=253017 RepID=UPI001FB13778|nr:uncharacterized protein LOC124939577 [Impatiens glandulifera]
MEVVSLAVETSLMNSSIGILDVYIHNARDIHNICIYDKQDVYATVYLTSDPETRVSTQIINGGGKNPVFNENLRLNVNMMIESSWSLRCEIWMSSRIKNYLEDQLLGFVVVDDIKNKDLPLEYELSSSDLLHVPAGSVKLTLTYEGIMTEGENSAVLKKEDVVVVQEEIMEMYMKSIIEATDAMVKIKLPSEGVDDHESGLDNYVETDERKFGQSKSNGRVFYGSRAFF